MKIAFASTNEHLTTSAKMFEYLLKNGCVFEMRSYWVNPVKPGKPFISYVDGNYFICIAQRTYAESILNEKDYVKRYGINAKSAIIMRVQISNKFVMNEKSIALSISGTRWSAGTKSSIMTIRI